jgi:hypothetical protein
MWGFEAQSHIVTGWVFEAIGVEVRQGLERRQVVLIEVMLAGKVDRLLAGKTGLDEQIVDFAEMASESLLAHDLVWAHVTRASRAAQQLGAGAGLECAVDAKGLQQPVMPQALNLVVKVPGQGFEQELELHGGEGAAGILQSAQNLKRKGVESSLIEGESLKRLHEILKIEIMFYKLIITIEMAKYKQSKQDLSISASLR